MYTNDIGRRQRSFEYAEESAVVKTTAQLISTMQWFFEREALGNHDYTDDPIWVVTKDHLTRRASNGDIVAAEACKNFGFYPWVRMQ